MTTYAGALAMPANPKQVFCLIVVKIQFALEGEQLGQQGAMRRLRRIPLDLVGRGGDCALEVAGLKTVFGVHWIWSRRGARRDFGHFVFRSRRRSSRRLTRGVFRQSGETRDELRVSFLVAVTFKVVVLLASRRGKYMSICLRSVRNLVVVFAVALSP